MAKPQQRPRSNNRNIKTKPRPGRANNRPVKGPIKNPAKFKNRPLRSNPRLIQDARQRLIQKKRPLADARDVLTKNPKIHDARDKLDRIRNGPGHVPNSKVKVIGTGIVQKVDRNGKISLVTTNKSRTTNTSDMNLAIRKQLGLIKPTRPQSKRSPPKRAPFRKSIVNELDSYRVTDPLQRGYEAGLYKWLKPDLRPASHLIGSLEPTRQAMRDVMREELLLANCGWTDFITRKPMRVQPSGYVDLDAAVEDEEMPLMARSPVNRIALKGSTRMSNVHSRLDSNPSNPFSHGILAQTKTKVVVPVGHRIVVSNLQPTVTEDDIKELFEDIGQLLSAKLVRVGIAEVIYKNLKDAQKAVDTYHNRQLDGQPMKCLLVNKGSNVPLAKSEGLFGRRVSSPPDSNKLVPDLSTFHKVLFQKK